MGPLPLTSPDELFTFPLFVAMLFVQQFGSASGMVMLLWPLGYMLWRRRDFPSVLRRQWLLLLLPLYMLLSSAWSEAPELTLRYGLEYVLTIMAGVAIAVSRDITRSMQGICAAFALYMLIAIAFGHSVGIGVGPGGEAFAGLTDSKNLVSDMASTGLLISLATCVGSLVSKRRLWGVFAFGCIFMHAYVIALTRSAGAIVAIVPALAAFLVLLAACAFRPRVRFAFTALLFASGAALFAALEPIMNWLLNVGADVFDKDPTLTGRTYLWYRAGDLIQEKPWFGRGFSAFWRQGNTDAVGMWQYGGITSQSGFNFHNAAVQVLVDLGWAGLTLCSAILIIGLFLMLRRFIARPTVWTVFSLAWMVYILVRAPFEVFGIAPFYYSTVLLYGVLGNALMPLPLRRPARMHQLRMRSADASDRSGAHVADGAPGRRRRAPEIIRIEPIDPHPHRP